LARAVLPSWSRSLLDLADHRFAISPQACSNGGQQKCVIAFEVRNLPSEGQPASWVTPIERVPEIPNLLIEGSIVASINCLASKSRVKAVRDGLLFKQGRH